MALDPPRRVAAHRFNFTDERSSVAKVDVQPARCAGKNRHSSVGSGRKRKKISAAICLFGLCFWIEETPFVTTRIL